MKLDFYMKGKKNKKYELIDTHYINYDDSKLNINDIKLFLINFFKNKYINNKEYKIKIKQTKHKIDTDIIKRTVVSVLLEHDVKITRNFKIKKVLQ